MYWRDWNWSDWWQWSPAASRGWRWSWPAASPEDQWSWPAAWRRAADEEETEQEETEQEEEEWQEEATQVQQERQAPADQGLRRRYLGLSAKGRYLGVSAKRKARVASRRKRKDRVARKLTAYENPEPGTGSSRKGGISANRRPSKHRQKLLREFKRILDMEYVEWTKLVAQDPDAAGDVFDVHSVAAACLTPSAHRKHREEMQARGQKLGPDLPDEVVNVLCAQAVQAFLFKHVMDWSPSRRHSPLFHGDVEGKLPTAAQIKSGSAPVSIDSKAYEAAHAHRRDAAKGLKAMLSAASAVVQANAPQEQDDEEDDQLDTVPTLPAGKGWGAQEEAIEAAPSVYLLAPSAIWAERSVVNWNIMPLLGDHISHSDRLLELQEPIVSAMIRFAISKLAHVMIRHAQFGSRWSGLSNPDSDVRVRKG